MFQQFVNGLKFGYHVIVDPTYCCDGRSCMTFTVGQLTTFHSILSGGNRKLSSSVDHPKTKAFMLPLGGTVRHGQGTIALVKDLALNTEDMAARQRLRMNTNQRGRLVSDSDLAYCQFE